MSKSITQSNFQQRSRAFPTASSAERSGRYAGASGTSPFRARGKRRSFLPGRVPSLGLDHGRVVNPYKKKADKAQCECCASVRHCCALPRLRRVHQARGPSEGAAAWEINRPCQTAEEGAGMRVCEIAVVGLGLIGSSAFHSLVRRGANVLGFDPLVLGEARGSSHGSCRVYRRFNFESAAYTELSPSYS